MSKDKGNEKIKDSFLEEVLKEDATKEGSSTRNDEKQLEDKSKEKIHKEGANSKQANTSKDNPTDKSNQNKTIMYKPKQKEAVKDPVETEKETSEKITIDNDTKQTEPKSLLDSFMNDSSKEDPMKAHIEVPKEVAKMTEHQIKKDNLILEAQTKAMTKETILREEIQIDLEGLDNGDKSDEVPATPEVIKVTTSQKKAPTKGKAKAIEKPKPKVKAEVKHKKDKSPKKPGTTKNSKKGLFLGLALILVVGIGAGGYLYLKGDKNKEPSEQIPPIVDTLEEEELEEELEEEIEDIKLEEEEIEEEEEEEIEEDAKESTLDLGETAFGKIKQFVADQVIVQEENTLNVYNINPSIREELLGIEVGSDFNFLFAKENDVLTIIEIIESGVSIDEDESVVVEDTEADDEDLIVESEADGSSKDAENVEEDVGHETISNSADFESAFDADFAEELESIRKREIDEELKNMENQEEKSKEEIKEQSTVETLQFPMESKGSGPLWFRFAWKTNDTTKKIAAIEDVYVELKTNNGTLVTPENASKYGRYWVDKGIINFAIRNGAQGNWTFLVTKSKSEKLGEIGANITPITGFIEVKKFSAKATQGSLLGIWKVDGVKDDELLVEIFAKRGDDESLLFSANSADSSLHLIDKVEISTAKLPKGTYDIIFKVHDIDVGKDDTGKKIVTAKHISDSYTVKNIDIY